MKKTISMMVLALAALGAWAQEPYACVTKGAVLEYASYNEENKVDGYSRQVIQEVKDLGEGNYDYQVQNSTISKPKQKGEGDEAYIVMGEIRGGTAQASVSGLAGSVDVTASNSGILSLPNKLAVGYQLPIGDVRASLDGVAVVVTVTENDVINREEVTVPAGTFKCYVVKQVMEMNMMGMAAITTTKTWYSRGVGKVKSETTMGNRLVARSELVTFKK